MISSHFDNQSAILPNTYNRKVGMHLLQLFVVSAASYQRNVPIIDKREKIKDK